jgi:DNA replication and repair protein RecF
MSLTKLKLTNFRNIKNADLVLSPECNIFYGQNGSGKTSLLESIYYLGHGRSFRTHITQHVVNDSSDNFSIFGEISRSGSIATPIGIERHLDLAHNKTRVAGENLKSMAELATILPIQLINQNSFALLNDGPKFRRRFLDWGLFHVEQSFLPIWKRLNRAVQQRNSALKLGAAADEMRLWNCELAEASVSIDNLRKDYLAKLVEITTDLSSEILGEFNITINYHPGWNFEKNLFELLNRNENRDKVLGYSQYGAHRADLLLKINKTPIDDVLSRGQQKIFFFVLQVAQGLLLTQETNKNCIYLIDDLPSELDEHKCAALMNLIKKIRNSQMFITCLESNILLFEQLTSSCKMFHVEHGAIT